MKNFQSALKALILLISIVGYAQRPDTPKVKVTGLVIEKVSRQPLEYATVTFTRPNDTKPVSGGITNAKGEFDIDVSAGTYDISIEFISFQVRKISQRELSENTNLGTIELAEDATQLSEVVVRSERTTVDIRLDKKVYNVGNDLMVKGGTVSDVLDNIPSVSVDAEGTVSLRGNENVRILIDGRPSNAINVAEALRLIPADAIDKVEVVTNPSARYDSEGGGGLLNIILKKGKNQGVNGTFIASAGHPETYGLSANINYKTEEFNLFTTTGYNYRTNPGNSINNTEYFNEDGTTARFVNERRENDRLNKGFNTNFGMEWYLDKTITWTNQLRLRKNSSSNPETVVYDNFDENGVYDFTTTRFSAQKGKNEDVEYSTNFVKKFKKEDHTLTIDGSFSREENFDDAIINGGFETTFNNQLQKSSEIQADYVLPIGKDSRFEAGYSGDFNDQVTDYQVNIFDNATGQLEADPQYTNTLEYKEKINALYSQFGTKYKKFSALLGLRWEDSNIDINQLTTSDFNNKRYNNFFPSAFLTYEFSEKNSASLSYSRRISRPRGRQINPFSNYSSNINIFQGNPDLDPAMTNAFDLGYLHRWDKITLSTSMYLNETKDAFQFIRRESGDFVTTQVNGGQDITDEHGQIVTVVDAPDVVTPVLLSTPINLATEYRFGFEFTLNYSPYKWWKLNSNFNLFRSETKGDYTYTSFTGLDVTENFDNTAYSWFARLNSKVTLPYKIDWQTNLMYNAPQNTAQSRNKGQFGVNLAFSKDLFKDKATLTLNVQDLFNSRKRITETFLERQTSYSEMQWRVRSINLSFTYRFNKKKTERERQPQQREENGGDEFPQ